MNNYLAPSLLSANFYNLENAIADLDICGIKYIHLDVMDGMFVPNISFGMPIIASLKKNLNDRYIFDTHLMIERPERYIDDFKKVGADILTIHAESTKDYVETLTYIKESGMKAGISISPKTDVHVLDDILKIADLILIMSVEPGFGGQKFIQGTLEKVKYLSDLKKSNNYKYMIEIDGGINRENIKSVKEAGADIIVVGSAVFNGDIKTNIKNLGEAYE